MRLCFAILLLAASALAASPEQDARKVVDDYVGLYTARTLVRWKILFHPQMTASHAASDGSIRVRTFEQFFASQENGFKEDPTMKETLHNIQLFMGNRMARVTADYIFTSKGEPSRGKIGLHLVQGESGWKIVGVVFSYDHE